MQTKAYRVDFVEPMIAELRKGIEKLKSYHEFAKDFPSTPEDSARREREYRDNLERLQNNLAIMLQEAKKIKNMTSPPN